MVFSFKDEMLKVEIYGKYVHLFDYFYYLLFL